MWLAHIRTPEMKKTVLIAVAALLLLFTTGAKLSRKERYTVGTVPSNPPMEMVDEEQRIIGFDIDVMKEIAERTNISIRLVPVLKENIYRGIIDESYDIVISSLTLPDGTSFPELPQIIFSEPYMEIGEVVVISEDFIPYTGLESLEGKRIGTLQNAPSKSILTERYSAVLQEYDGMEAAFEDMARGTIDVIVCDLPLASRMVHLNDEYRNIFKIVPEPLTRKRYVIAVKKGNTDLLSTINAGIDKIKTDGTLEELIGRWFFPE
jgi:ABC-type amino acid transport substrate-binding protein